MWRCEKPKSARPFYSSKVLTESKEQLTSAATSMPHRPRCLSGIISFFIDKVMRRGLMSGSFHLLWAMFIILIACSRMVRCIILLKTLFVFDLPSKLFKSSFTFVSSQDIHNNARLLDSEILISFHHFSPHRSVFPSVLWVSVLRLFLHSWTCHFYNINQFLPSIRDNKVWSVTLLLQASTLFFFNIRTSNFGTDTERSYCRFLAI